MNTLLSRIKNIVATWLRRAEKRRRRAAIQTPFD